MSISPVGFGFIDASEYQPQPDTSSWLIKNILPKSAFGFIAGPPKAGASPHGGKSVLQRKMALCLLTQKQFLGYDVLETGKVMFVNLDEDLEQQVRLYYRMTRGEKIPGYLISQARSCQLPEQISLLEADIAVAKPKLVMIDPLQRTLGNKGVRNQEDVGPIINELKRISKTYECTVAVSHHSNKDQNRDKETTPSWLGGSNDLDAAWDFCLCVEYDKSSDAIHLRNFQKVRAKTDVFYEAEIINEDQIIDLHRILDELKTSKQARNIYNFLLSNPTVNSTNTTTQWLSKKMGVAEGSIRFQLSKFAVIKNRFYEFSQPVENKDDKCRSEISES